MLSSDLEKLTCHIIKAFLDKTTRGKNENTIDRLNRITI